MCSNIFYTDVVVLLRASDWRPMALYNMFWSVSRSVDGWVGGMDFWLVGWLAGWSVS